MSRILLLIVIVLWMSRAAAPGVNAPLGMAHGGSLFIGGLLLVVLFMGLWSRILARQVRGDNLHLSLRRFHNSMFAARLLIPIWFGVAVFILGWPHVVARALGPARYWPIELPGMILGTLPAVLTWMALWWAQYPADRALREQSLLIQLDENLPVHSPPGFWSYFVSNLRLQVLFTFVPVALIILLHDIASIVLWNYSNIDLYHASPGGSDATIELILQLASIAIVVLFAPEVLRRVLHTQRLPDSPLRSRLEALCQRTGMRYRDILLWRTNHNMGNAAVMGLVPWMRYILLSDVLLETMTDQQIEAVFAHEIGHVKHWHMGWYIVLVATLMLLIFGPVQMLGGTLSRWHRPSWLSDDAITGVIGVGGFILIFGYLSRWFERQADVFAARTMQQQDNLAATPVYKTYVGKHGAMTFASALYRVAIINNIPISARNFTHGSIVDRMNYVQTLSADPTRTLRFDRSMSMLYAMMIFILLACAAWVIVAWGVQSPI
ncbi:MAG TPA: M48 family metallopeptidase [Tepidisphaeraceae bacterium]|nr:M48 family metallopeptidase [Tepidisphaeraceae bacterium]